MARYIKYKFGFFFLALSISASAQDLRDRPSWYLGGYVGQSAIILGSEDTRAVQGVTFGYAKPERRFRYRSMRAQMAIEVSLDRSYSVGARFSPGTSGYGAWIVSRYHGRRDDRGQCLFLDVGWGLQYADRRTRDLDSRLNSSPVIGVGSVYPFGNQELLASLRWMHLSNGGFVPDNQGSNRFLLTIGVRF